MWILAYWVKIVIAYLKYEVLAVSICTELLKKGDVNKAVPCVRVYPLGALNKKRNSKVVTISLHIYYAGRNNYLSSLMDVKHN